MIPQTALDGQPFRQREEIPLKGRDNLLVQSIARLTPEMQRALLESSLIEEVRNYMVQNPYDAPAPSFALSEICSISGDAVGKVFRGEKEEAKKLLIRQASLAIQTILAL